MQAGRYGLVVGAAWLHLQTHASSVDISRGLHMTCTSCRLIVLKKVPNFHTTKSNLTKLVSNPALQNVPKNYSKFSQHFSFIKCTSHKHDLLVVWSFFKGVYHHTGADVETNYSSVIFHGRDKLQQTKNGRLFSHEVTVMPTRTKFDCVHRKSVTLNYSDHWVVETLRLIRTRL